MIILETQRLILRRFAIDDLDNLFAFYGDPDVIRYIPDAPRSYAETKEELEWFLNGHPKFPDLGLWATIYKPTDRFIGRCGLLPWRIDGQNEVEVAFAFSKEYWGQGLATEAAQALVQYGFESLGLTRLVCLIDEKNEVSIKVAMKIGMKFDKKSEDEKGPFLLYAISKAA